MEMEPVAELAPAHADHEDGAMGATTSRAPSQPAAHLNKPGSCSAALLAPQQRVLPLVPTRVYAVAAVWVAAKVMETREELPSMTTLAAIARSSPGVLSEAELRILQWCDWAPMAGFEPVV
eukprot:XP_001695385.1 predicted protein [Chlamydomonas reinhardtii]